MRQWERMERYWVGLDLGQRQDYSTLAVVAKAVWPGEWDPVTWSRPESMEWRVTRLERFRLGTPYVQVARETASLMRELKGQARAELAVDATGVGVPVAELLLRERTGCTVTPVMITSGDQTTRTDRFWNVPRRTLLGGVTVALEQGLLRIRRRLPLSAALVEELAGLRADGGARSGKHDDLALALALAVWMARRGTVGERNDGRLV